MMPITKLSEDGRILIPKHLRRALGLMPGSKVHLSEEGGRLAISPVPADPIAAATGFLKVASSLTAVLRREHSKETR